MGSLASLLKRLPAGRCSSLTLEWNYRHWKRRTLGLRILFVRHQDLRRIGLRASLVTRHKVKDR